MNKKFFLIILAFFFFSSVLFADVTLPSIISDNMVLQQQTDVALWGTAAPGAKVTVKAGWTKQTFSTVADPQTGRFILTVPTPSAGGPYDIVFSDGKKTVVSNVLIGEVWFCSGQSNMEHYVKGYHGEPVDGSAETICSANPSRQIRICQVDHSSSIKIADSVNAKWCLNDSESVANSSAVAYYFADRMEKALNVPVGIIISCWGGSTMWTWMSEELLRSEFPGVGDLRHLSGEIPVRTEYQDPCLLYNGMIRPLEPYTFKGILWYQGCSDRDNPLLYSKMQPAFVKMMRKEFNVPDAPFYFVQISPYFYGDENGVGTGYFLTDGQEACLDIIPNSGMVTTCDLGKIKSIHYPQKQIVADRLSLLALEHDYGLKGIHSDPPRYIGYRVEDGKIVVKYTPCGGLTPIGAPLEGFEIAGIDGVYHTANAEVNWKCYDEVVIWSDDVPAPVAARYCYRNWCHGNLYNISGVPAAPFRTDKKGFVNPWTEQISAISSRLNKDNHQTDRFVFFADTHSEKAELCLTPVVIDEILGKVDVKNVVFGGDFCMTLNNCANKEDLDRSVVKFKKNVDATYARGGHFYTIRGNHDMTTGTINPEHPGWTYSQSHVYSTLMGFSKNSPYTECGDGTCNYYFDNEQAKIRHIVIDPYSSADENLVKRYGIAMENASSAAEWCRKSFETLPQGWKAVVMLHQGLNGMTGFSDFGNCDATLKVVEANADKVALVLHGHVHKDAEAFQKGILHVATTACLYKESKADLFGLAKRIPGTKDECAIDVAEIDVNASKVNFHRVGFGYDRFINTKAIELSAGGRFALSSSLKNVTSWKIYDADGVHVRTWHDWDKYCIIDNNHAVLEGTTVVAKDMPGEVVVVATDEDAKSREYFYVVVK